MCFTSRNFQGLFNVCGLLKKFKMKTNTKNGGAAVNYFLEFMRFFSWNKTLEFRGTGKADGEENSYLNMPKYDLMGMPNFGRITCFCMFRLLT